MRHVLALFLAVVATALVVVSAQHPAMPAGMSHAEHLAQLQQESELKRRGATAMGFDQNAATHHFRLTRTGGVIEVGANDRRDVELRRAIRTHLASIASDFAEGRFSAPIATHAEISTGVEAMQRFAGVIAYMYEETDAGGRVHITSDPPDAIAAIQSFLRYQIREHRTGDELTIHPDGPR